MSKKIFFFLGKIGYFKSISLFFVIILTTFFELITLGSIFPLVKIIFTPDWIINLDLPINVKNYFLGLNSIELINLFLFAFLVIYILRTLFILYSIWFNNNLGYKISVKFGEDLFKKYLSQPYRFHSSRNSSELIRNIHDEVGRLVKISLFPLIFLISELFLLISIFSILIFIDPIPVLFFLGVYAIFGIFYFSIFGKKLKAWGHKRQLHSMYRYKSLLQALSGIKDIILGNKFKFFINRYVSENIIVSKISRNFTIIQQIPKIFMEFIFLLLIIIFIKYNFNSNINIDNILPNITIFFASAFRLMPSVNKIYQNLQYFKVGGATLEKLYVDFNIPESQNNYNLEDEEQPRKIKFNKKIKISSLYFKYNENSEKFILKDLNLEIFKGECVGIMGPSGTGKTTFLDLILGLLNPSSGQILFDGKNINSYRKEWQNLIGHIPQEIYLLDDTIKNNIAIGIDKAKIDPIKLDKSVNQSQLGDYLNKLPDGLNTIVGERGRNISGGEKQRIGIARSLYKDNEILIFDEATSALDKDNEKKILDEIQSLKVEKTIILISHNHDVFRICDKIYKFENNNLVKLHD